MKNVYTVSKINKYIKNLIEKDIFLNDVFIEGEISNFKAHGSGHYYFSLKDANASINAIMYKGNTSMIDFMPENGMKVTVYGYISAYEKTGQYQVYVRMMEQSGKGTFYISFEKLKKKLEDEGLFLAENKKSIPENPKTVAVITSPTGAAIRDIIKISGRRNKNTEIVVIPSLVQGKDAPDEIVKALKDVNKWNKADVIILARGGGSSEDLWCFNSEKVAREIYKSKIPVISAIGHETDFTIADFTADLRASTPSAAAEIVVSDFNIIYDRFNELKYSLERKIYNILSKKKYDLKLLAKESVFFRLDNRIKRNKKYLLELLIRLTKSMEHKIEKESIRYCGIISRLEDISPVNILKRGYSLTYDKNKNLITSVENINIDDILITKISTGVIKSRVIDKGE